MCVCSHDSGDGASSIVPVPILVIDATMSVTRLALRTNFLAIASFYETRVVHIDLDLARARRRHAHQPADRRQSLGSHVTDESDPAVSRSARYISAVVNMSAPLFDLDGHPSPAESASTVVSLPTVHNSIIDTMRDKADDPKAIDQVVRAKVMY